jgi:recombination associated protein RdgC
VVRETLEERIATIEAHEARSVRGKERRRLRDEVTFDLLPRAFTRSHHTYAYLSPRDGWLVVDASSPKRAEELSGLLARSCEGLGIVPFGTEQPVSAEMTAWVARQSPPPGFVLLEDCELRDPAEQGSVVRCQRQDLSGREIRAHLEARKQVQRLALGFEDRLSLVLAADLTVKRLRFDAVEELDDIDEADEVARFDANYAFMTSELSRFLGRLAQVFPPV